ncbi:MAG: hypothetical protein AVDCRST_MAG49-2732, partial [uncultured Thermomicrobiales bacterium]
CRSRPCIHATRAASASPCATARRWTRSPAPSPGGWPPSTRRGWSPPTPSSPSRGWSTRLSSLPTPMATPALATPLTAWPRSWWTAPTWSSTERGQLKTSWRLSRTARAASA